ncbi:MAG: hypothetical protein ACI89D_001881 [Bermanella sp.]|jgi:hypothetical protein
MSKVKFGCERLADLFMVRKLFTVVGRYTYCCKVNGKSASLVTVMVTNGWARDNFIVTASAALVRRPSTAITSSQ